MKDNAPAAQKQAANAPSTVDELSEKQREVYQAQVNFYKKNADHLESDKIHERALAAAGRFKAK